MSPDATSPAPTATGTIPPAPTDAGADTAPAVFPKGKLSRKLSVDGKEREVLYHVPSKVDGNKAVPVVLMLHGTSGDGEKFYNISGWVEKAEQEGFIAAFPSGLVYCLYQDENRDGVRQDTEYNVTSKWSDGKLGGADSPLCSDDEIARVPKAARDRIQSRTIVDDVAFVRAVVSDLRAGFPIDPSRVYVSGFSNGAQMAARLAVEANDVFAAAAVAGGNLTVDTIPNRKTPVFVSLGEVDENALGQTGVPEDPNDNLSAFPLDPSIFAIPQVAANITKLAGALGIDPAARTFSTTTVSGKKIARFELGAKAPGATGSMVFVVLEGVPHAYPNGKVAGSPLVMTDMLWPFFSSAKL